MSRVHCPRTLPCLPQGASACPALQWRSLLPRSVFWRNTWGGGWHGEGGQRLEVYLAYKASSCLCKFLPAPFFSCPSCSFAEQRESPHLLEPSTYYAASGCPLTLPLMTSNCPSVCTSRHCESQITLPGISAKRRRKTIQLHEPTLFRHSFNLHFWRELTMERPFNLHVCADVRPGTGVGHAGMQMLFAA